MMKKMRNVISVIRAASSTPHASRLRMKAST
jgi:hypothetical protein